MYSDTIIRMFDGSVKKAREVEIGDLALGRNTNGEIVSNEILFIRKKLNKEWLSIKCKKRGMNRGGNHYISLTCSPDCLIWDNKTNDFKTSNKLNVNDWVLAVRNSLSLSSVQQQVILGKLIGDGSISIRNLSASLSFSHSQKQNDYIQWTCMSLGDICAKETPSDTTFSGYGSEMTKRRTNAYHCIYELIKDFYIENEKQIPIWLPLKMTPIVMAFWYMDDGSLIHESGQEDRAAIATNSFNNESIQILQKSLEKFDIKSESYFSNGWRLRMNAFDADKFFLLIAPYIPSSMQYKLPKKYRGHDGWMPKHTSNFQKWVLPQVIFETDFSNNKNRACYSFDTETNNLFASDILIATY